ncbi:MAG: response regulator [Geminicoccaceae bacterium]
MKHVLAVDDDPAIRTMIAEYLVGQSFQVSTAASSPEMTRILADKVVDLIILDLKLADEDGLELVRKIRAESDLPIIVLTGHRREEVDRIVGLELGADDYLTKPISLRELLARVRAVLRRSASLNLRSKQGTKRLRYRFARWDLDLRTRQLRSPAGNPVPLTRGELGVLMAFLQSPQQVLSREQLLAATRLHDEEVYDRSVDVQILRVRRTLEANPSAPEMIKTERGAGYVFAVPVEVVEGPPVARAAGRTLSG